MNTKPNSGSFKEGNEGKPKGAVSQVTKDAKKLFLAIMDGEVPHIQAALKTLREKKGGELDYIQSLARLMPYFLPKKMELDVNDNTKIVVTLRKPT